MQNFGRENLDDSTCTRKFIRLFHHQSFTLYGNLLTQISSCTGRLQVENVLVYLFKHNMSHICSLWSESIHDERSCNLSSCSVDSNYSTSCTGKSQPKNTHVILNMKHILTDLNQYTTAMHLVIILTDDAIKHTCIWPLGWCNNIRHKIHWHLFSDFSPFGSPVKEKGKQWRMKGLTIAQ